MSPGHSPPDRADADQGMWVNSGYSRHRIMCSPADWRILADLITSRLEHSPFGLDQVFAKRSFDQI